MISRILALAHEDLISTYEPDGEGSWVRGNPFPSGVVPDMLEEPHPSPTSASRSVPPRFMLLQKKCPQLWALNLWEGKAGEH